MYLTISYFTVRTRFEVERLSEVKIVLCDGCQIVDDDAFELLGPQTDLYILKDDEQLHLPSTSSTSPSSGMWYLNHY